MAEDNKIPVVIRTQVYLSDPDYFCNKSWTMSYNMNTGSWISFHTYIPNFYIGENNFFYSGLNGCCDDADAGGFQVIAGVLDPKVPTTSTTTTYPRITTTSTTTIIDCTLMGRGVITDCDLDGTGIITVPTVPTTTICQRPSNLTVFILIQGYTLGTDPEVIFTNSSQDACDAIPAINYVNSIGNTDGSTIDKFNSYVNNISDELALGNIVYYGDSNDCTFVPDGWYVCQTPLPLSYVYNIIGGVVVDIVACDCATTTTTTTSIPNITECCGILLSSTDAISYLNKTTDVVSPLNVPGYVTSLGIAMTVDKLWSIDTDIKEWDIILAPFSATFNRTISFPGGFTTSSGIVALNNTTLIGINDTPSQQEVTELDITTLSASATIKFTLQTDRVAYGNPLYIQTGQILIINKDTVSSDYYISQYNYSTGALELEINIGSVQAISIFECNCDIYVTDVDGRLYVIIKIAPYVLLYLGVEYTINVTSISSATQVGTCVTSPIDQNTTTTTTTTIP
jgi:hypothetical protein